MIKTVNDQTVNDQTVNDQILFSPQEETTDVYPEFVQIPKPSSVTESLNSAEIIAASEEQTPTASDTETPDREVEASLETTETGQTVVEAPQTNAPVASPDVIDVESNAEISQNQTETLSETSTLTSTLLQRQVVNNDQIADVATPVATTDSTDQVATWLREEHAAAVKCDESELPRSSFGDFVQGLMSRDPVMLENLTEREKAYYQQMLLTVLATEKQVQTRNWLTGLRPKVVRLDSNGTNLGIFSDQIQYILAR